MTEVVQHLDLIPSAMAERPQWLVWRFEQQDGDKKPRKVPYYVGGGRRLGDQGSDKDRAALVTLEGAAACMRAKGFTGVGFAFLPGDGMIGIDLDNAIDPDTGEVAQVALDVVAACASFTEVTPSGRGLHIYVTHPPVDKDAGRALSGRANDLGNGVGLEMYCGRQFFTVTGNAFAGSQTGLAEISDAAAQHIKGLIERGKRAGRQPAQQSRAPAQVSDQDERRLIESALAFVDADVGYNDWIAVGMAIYDRLGEGALAVWDYWSSRGSKYAGSNVLAQKWTSFGGRSPGTAGVIFTLAKQAGWVRPRIKRSEPPPVSAPPEAAPDSALPEPPADMLEPPMDDAYMASIAATADWISQFRRNDKGNITPSLFNTLLVLENDPKWRGAIAFDSFAYRIVHRLKDGSPGGEWIDSDDVMAMVYLTREYRFEPRKPTVMDAVQAQALTNRFDPLRDYLDGLVWDGVPRVKKAFLTYWGALSTPDVASLDEEERARLRVYLQCAAVKWFVGAVARGMSPGCKLDTMLVMEGGQGAKKSSSLRLLFGDAFFSDSKLNLGDKDALSQMQGKWGYEMGEMDAFNKAEDTLFKQFMSSQVDRVRWHYGKRAEDVPRRSIFIGTTNQGQYGKDPTGMRRVWPMTTGFIDLEAIGRDRDQLWAEAVHLWRDKARWWVDRDVVVIRKDQAEFGGRDWTEWDLFEEQADKRQVVDAWAQPILEYIGKHTAQEHFTTAELFEHALELRDKARWTRAEQMRVGGLMALLGFKNAKRGPKNRRYNAWVAKEVPKTEADDQEGDDSVPL